jgi:monovalent cation/hydrogen antiporter
MLQTNSGTSPEEPSRGSSDGQHMRAVRAGRRALLAMRSSGKIGDDAFHRLEEELDRIELSAT